MIEYTELPGMENSVFADMGGVTLSVDMQTDAELLLPADIDPPPDELEFDGVVTDESFVDQYGVTQTRSVYDLAVADFGEEAVDWYLGAYGGSVLLIWNFYGNDMV